MKKRILVAICIILTLCLIIPLASCSDNKTNVLFLGDSIAEALVGPSPISERENYGYYGILGQINNYSVINRGISGDKTADLLSYLKVEDKDSTMTRSHLIKADVIHLSIGGNDLLQEDFSGLFYNLYTNKTAKIDELVGKATKNITEIITLIRKYNPNALLLVQNVYNPLYPDSPLIDKETRDKIGEYSDKQYRDLGDKMMKLFEKMFIDNFKTSEKPFVYIDIFTPFKEIYNEDPVRGKNLIYPDGVHPSNEGHAIIAQTIQETLINNGLAKEKAAVSKYKSLKIEQLKRMYPDVYQTGKNQINKANNLSEVTKAYFSAVSGLLPSYN